MKKSQSKRILEALLRGETVSWLWGVKQNPPISKTTNRCSEMRHAGLPISKRMVRPDDGAKYMAYFITKENIGIMKRKSAIEMYEREKRQRIISITTIKRRVKENIKLIKNA